MASVCHLVARMLLALAVLAAPAAAAAPAGLTGPDVGAFLDARMPRLLSQGDIAGAAVAVVADGEVLLVRGYGHADLARRSPMTPDTLVRPGSISKLVTWTAVMQLAQAGRVDLDAPVQAYVDIPVPDRFGRPITLRHLMTHTAGFDEVTRDLFARTPAERLPLRTYLLARAPDQVRAPGSAVAYSNYGTALAGHVVERVSGEPFADYAERHVLAPLGMTRSTFVQPPPAAWGDASQGYLSARAARPQPFEVITAAPAGGMSTTVRDLARLAIAHLEGGAILDPATTRRMHARAWTAAPGREGFALGFFSRRMNGREALEHDGDTLAFHSDLLLFPRERVGLIVVLNSAGNGLDVRRELTSAFLDRYLPPTASGPAPASWPGAAAQARRVEGWYETTRRNERALRLRNAAWQRQVRARPDGDLEVTIWGDPEGRTRRWRATGPLTYRQVGGTAGLSFIAAPDGRTTSFIADDDPPIEQFERVPRGRSRPALQWGGALAAATLLAGLLLAATRPRDGDAAPWARRLRRAAVVGQAAQLGVLAGWPLAGTWIGDDLWLRISGGGDPVLHALHVASVVALLGVPATLAAMVAGMRRGGGPVGLLRDGLAVLGGAYAAWFILAFGLASFSVRY